MARAGRLALEQFVARVGDVDDDLHAGPCRIWNTLPHWMVSAPRSALTMNDSLTPTLPAASSWLQLLYFPRGADHAADVGCLFDRVSHG